jgi:DNA-binding transcriptional MerR regulator
MAKSADAFRTISEVSTELDVPKHVLRFWEQRFKQLKPLKRGGGRRFYRPEDVELIKGIQTLLNRDAYTIRGVQKILREHGVEHVKGLATTEATDNKITSLQAPEAKAAMPAATVPAVGSETARRKKTARAGTVAGAPSSRDVVAAVIAELGACRALLMGDAAKSKSHASSGAAASRR